MEGKRVRRRLVQSTLFPQKESSVNEGENCNGDREEETKEEEERCGNGKKRRESKRKADPKPKKTPPAASRKLQVAENGAETSIKLLDGCDSPVAAGGRSTPRKPKRQGNSTPKKNSTPKRKMTSGARELCCGRIPFDLMVDEQPLQTIPDLRLEAKRTAEENSRIFAGREIHPFFTSRRGKTSQNFTDSESKWSSFERKEKGITFNPIHVFESVEDDHKTLDWGQWIFSERSSMGCLECGGSPIYGGSVDSLNFDNFLGLSPFTRNSSCQNSDQCSVPEEEVPMRLPEQPEYSHPISPLSLADKTIICSEHKDSYMLAKDDENTVAASVELFYPGLDLVNMDYFAGSSSGGRLASELKDKLRQERIMSHNHTCHNQPENSLWTDKYKPQNAKQICGNGESVRLMSEWLHLWHKRGYLANKSCSNEGKPDVRDIDHDYQQSDSDSDSADDEEGLKNVLLVTGPVGSGKSAAIYACAGEQRFQVIEINASDWRNGALIKQKFGEAVESHWLQSTVEKAPSSDNKSLSKFFTAVKAETNCSDDQVFELIDLSDKEDLPDASGCQKIPVSREDKAANYQTEIKNLILFEDVDATLYEDHGFITTIQQLAETAKRPMILTSNSDDPILPKNLDRLELSFSAPSVEELLGLVCMISAAEKIEIHPSLVERFVDYCHGDIRKTIMLLQFWSQGQTLEGGSRLCKTYSPIPFELDAGHHILPKLIPWEYPSQLSALVAEEVVKSLLLMEETHCSVNLDKDEELIDCIAENIRMQHSEPDCFEAKKEAMLKLHCTLEDEVYTEFQANSELPSSSGSPITFARQNSRRKINAVLSSDSEDEFAGGITALVSDGLLDINVEVTDMKSIPTSQYLSTEICYRPAEQIYHSEIDMLEDDCCQLPETVDYSHIHESCKSPDMSIVPESSFVPETQIIDETDLYTTTVSHGHFVAAGASFIIQDQDSVPFLESAVCSRLNNSLHTMHNDREIFGNSCDASTAFVYQEEVGDSVSKCEGDCPRGFQLLDECSRVDFMRLNSLDKSESEQAIDHVQESWNKLHAQREDLRKHVTEEEKNACQVLKLGHGMSNLISEVDLLLKDCQTPVSDSLRSSMIPCEKTLSYSYYDNQWEMASILGQHGMCFYAKEIASLGSINGSANKVDLASEMLTTSASSIALGKLASQNHKRFDISDRNTPKSSNVFSRKPDFSLSDILQSVVPSRSYLAAKGGAFHEYLSTLCQISRFEASRLSECLDKRQKRRVRVARHYLSSGSLAMSSEEISLLDRYNSYQKVPSLLKDES